MPLVTNPNYGFDNPKFYKATGGTGGGKSPFISFYESAKFAIKGTQWYSGYRQYLPFYYQDLIEFRIKSFFQSDIIKLKEAQELLDVFRSKIPWSPKKAQFFIREYSKLDKKYGKYNVRSHQYDWWAGFRTCSRLADTGRNKGGQARMSHKSSFY